LPFLVRYVLLAAGGALLGILRPNGGGTICIAARSLKSATPTRARASDEREIHVGAGDLFVAKPGEAHEGAVAREPLGADVLGVSLRAPRAQGRRRG